MENAVAFGALLVAEPPGTSSEIRRPGLILGNGLPPGLALWTPGTQPWDTVKAQVVTERAWAIPQLAWAAPGLCLFSWCPIVCVLPWVMNLYGHSRSSLEI